MQIYLLLTEKCNLNCSMCIRGNKENNELSLSQLTSLPWIGELSKHDIVITGGEPTLAHDFVPIVSCFAGMAHAVSICTNGTTDYYIDKNLLPDNVSIQISIDGTEEYHDAIRGRNTFKRIFRTISLLESKGISYTVSSVVSRKNVSCMPNLADELAKLKCMKYWNISYEMPFGHASLDELMSAEEWNNFVDKMLNYVEFRMKIQKMFPFELYDKNRDKLDELFKGRKCSNCGSGRNKIYIYPDLTVYPCTCLTDFPLGNLKEMPLSEIMATETAKKFADYTILPESKCSKCEYLRYCNGGCIGMSYNYFHKLGMGDVRCPKIQTL